MIKIMLSIIIYYIFVKLFMRDNVYRVRKTREMKLIRRRYHYEYYNIL